MENALNKSYCQSDAVPLSMKGIYGLGVFFVEDARDAAYAIVNGLFRSKCPSTFGMSVGSITLF
jgi:hypothetical protein